jgi:hypothetical protein
MIAKQRTRGLVGIVTALLVVTCVGSIGCASPEVTPPPVVTPSEPDGAQAPTPDAVRIRVSNDGTATLHDVVVKFPGGEGSSGQDASYGDIAPGETSEYRRIARAYGYAYVAAVADGEKRVLQPIDYVGEEPLATGDYTYVLRATPGASGEDGGIDLELRSD